MIDSNSKKADKAGFIIGLVLLVLGSILTGVLLYMVSSAKSLPKLLIAGPVISSVGLSMIIFPGGDYSYKELKVLERKEAVRQLWTKAPIFHKLAWIIFGVIGIGISFKILIDQEFLVPL